MPIPQALRGKLAAPVIGAPMFLVSFPPLVAALCKAGVVGTFPHVNARPAEQFEQWLTQLETELEQHRREHPDRPAAPFGVNLVVHRTNPRFQQDLETVVRHRVPLVLTSLGHPGEVVGRVHAYGGLVFSDVTNAAHARKAAQAGVDGLICVGGGAGGHAPTQSAFSLVREIREFWDGCLVLGGSINDGWQVRAAEMLGADFAYMGTRFIASRESAASEDYKRMLVESGVEDLVYTDRLSGIGCNFLKPSLARHGVDPATLPPKTPDLSVLTDTTAKVWRDLWTAGHGIATIHDVPSVAGIVARLAAEYRAACGRGPSAALAG
ncbi:NAD(P)H-dependent flavin oxidoreductase [Nevskia soli]|uniref:NAD(P)H-dependent flavin oxidoreductase n=1 Tax=Nevskia soli TaxID=418856 RepID=UPI0004A6E22D|nr:nitronate monooxygenase [Nevskia soli]